MRRSNSRGDPRRNEPLTNLFSHSYTDAKRERARPRGGGSIQKQKNDQRKNNDLPPPPSPFPSFRLGRQEDAHEYLIALLDAMHEACLARAPGAPRGPRPPPALAATSLVYALFSGSLRSTLTCAECGAVSATSEPFLCVSLDVGGADDVTGALARFTAGETLDGADAWRCPRQARAVRATKALAIETCPRVLCLQLKRFSYAHGGRKLSRRVDYPPSLDVAPWTVAGRQGGGAHPSSSSASTTYALHGVLVHSGHSLHCGHYTAYVRAPDGR